MNFKEQFPSFDYTKEPVASMVFNDGTTQRYLMKKCLDKQIVRETLNAYLVHLDNGMDTRASENIKRIMKELGLDE